MVNCSFTKGELALLIDALDEIILKARKNPNFLVSVQEECIQLRAKVLKYGNR